MDAIETPENPAPRKGHGQKGRSGPPGNKNALTHGWRGYLATGKLPPGSSYLRKQLTAFRKALEAGVVAKAGEVSLTSAAAIQSVVQHEAHRQLLGRWLAAAPADLRLETRVATLDAIARAVDRRDKCLRSLDLDASLDGDDWAALDRERRARKGGWLPAYGGAAAPDAQAHTTTTGASSGATTSEEIER